MNIKKILVFLIIFINFNVFSEEFLLKNIHLQGLKYVSKNSIKKLITFKKNQLISQKQIDTLIKSIFDTGKFQDIKILNKNNELFIYLKEYPIIIDIIFSGNKNIKKYEIRNILKNNNIYIGYFLNPYNIYSFKSEIKKFYESIGEYFNNIKIHLKHFNNNKSIIIFKFREIKNTQIRKINIIGNKFFTTKKILSQFYLKDYVPWWNIQNNKKYNSQLLLTDLYNLQDFYFNKGFIKYQINSIKVSFHDKKNIYLSYNISENSRYKFEKVKINSNIKKHDLKIKIDNIVKKYKNQIFSFEKIQEIKDYIKQEIGIYGYIFPTFHINNNINNIKKTVNTTIDLNINDFYYVNKINIQGNDTSKDNIVRREIPQIENKIINLNLVEQGKNNLDNTGFFDEVIFYFEKLKNDKNKIKFANIYYFLKERETGSFNVGMGYGVENGLSIQGSIQKDNLLGSGNNITFTMSKENDAKSIELSLYYPYLINNKFSLNHNISLNKFKESENKDIKYSYQKYGIDSIIGIPVNRYNVLKLGLGFNYDYLINVNSQVNILKYLKHFEIINKQNYLSRDFTLNYGWTYKKLDKFLFPSKGIKIDLDNKITIPNSDNHYHKVVLDIQKYIPINKYKNFVFYIHNKIGYGHSIDKEPFPFHEKFITSKFGYVRGLNSNNNNIITKEIYYNIDKLKCYNKKLNKNNNKTKKEKFCLSNDSTGSHLIAILNLEIIIPIQDFIKIKYNNLRVSTFFDLGFIKNNNINIYKNKNLKISYLNKNNIRASLGLSAKWLSPLGLLEISYAIPFNTDKNDKIEKFQFNFGKNW